jgi:serine/threonine-protein kinase
MAAGRFSGFHGLVLLSLGLPRAAWALGGTDLAMAEALFQEGRKLLEQKRYAEACPKFAESQRLDPGIGTLLNLATCHELEGKTATAWSEFTQALGIAERESRSDAQQFARGHLAALTPKLPKIAIAVPKENDVPGLEVSLDGQALGKPAWGVAAPIDPGTHVVVGAAAGRKRWTTQVTFAAGEQKTVSVPLLETEAPGETTPPPAPAATDEVPLPARSAEPSVPAASTVPAAGEPRTGQTQRMAGIVVGGAGVVAMGAGIIIALSAKSTYDESDAYCDASGCDPQGLELRSRAVDRGQLATALFTLGAGTAIGGTVLWLTAPRDQTPPRVARIVVGPSGLAVKGTW